MGARNDICAAELGSPALLWIGSQIDELIEVDQRVHPRQRQRETKRSGEALPPDQGIGLRAMEGCLARCFPPFPRMRPWKAPRPWEIRKRNWEIASYQSGSLVAPDAHNCGQQFVDGHFRRRMRIGRPFGERNSFVTKKFLNVLRFDRKIDVLRQNSLLEQLLDI